MAEITSGTIAKRASAWNPDYSTSGVYSRTVTHCAAIGRTLIRGLGPRACVLVRPSTEILAPSAPGTREQSTAEPIGHLPETFERLRRLDSMASHDIYFGARISLRKSGRRWGRFAMKPVLAVLAIVC